MINKITVLVLVFLFFGSCEKLDNTLLHGNWKGAVMIKNGQVVEKGADGILFQFEPNGTYTYSVSAHQEAGKFHTLEDKLYTTDTTQTNRLEKVVRVSHLSADSLFLEMNAGGVSQLLKCYKAK